MNNYDKILNELPDVIDDEYYLSIIKCNNKFYVSYSEFDTTYGPFRKFDELGNEIDNYYEFADDEGYVEFSNINLYDALIEMRNYLEKYNLLENKSKF